MLIHFYTCAHIHILFHTHFPILSVMCWDFVHAMQVKIQGQNKEMLAAACQMFLGKSEIEISQIALETLEGHQRAIIAHLTVEARKLLTSQTQWRQ